MKVAATHAAPQYISRLSQLSDRDDVVAARGEIKLKWFG